MFLDEPDHVLISSLKGRVSKVLNSSRKLNIEERNNLEAIYNIIDDLILDRNGSSILCHFVFDRGFKELSKSTRPYIKKHILPLINKVNIKKWR